MPLYPLLAFFLLFAPASHAANRSDKFLRELSKGVLADYCAQLLDEKHDELEDEDEDFQQTIHKIKAENRKKLSAALNGLDINQVVKGKTLVEHAASHANDVALELLLENGARIDNISPKNPTLIQRLIPHLFYDEQPWNGDPDKYGVGHSPEASIRRLLAREDLVFGVDAEGRSDLEVWLESNDEAEAFAERVELLSTLIRRFPLERFPLHTHHVRLLRKYVVLHGSKELYEAMVERGLGYEKSDPILHAILNANSDKALWKSLRAKNADAFNPEHLLASFTTQNFKTFEMLANEKALSPNVFFYKKHQLLGITLRDIRRPEALQALINVGFLTSHFADFDKHSASSLVLWSIRNPGLIPYLNYFLADLDLGDHEFLWYSAIFPFIQKIGESEDPAQNIRNLIAVLDSLGEQLLPKIHWTVDDGVNFMTNLFNFDPRSSGATRHLIMLNLSSLWFPEIEAKIGPNLRQQLIERIFENPEEFRPR